MSKHSQRKRRIQQSLDIVNKYPEEALANLKNLQKGVRNTPTYGKIQDLIDGIENSLDEKRTSAYRKYFGQFRVNIPEQSQRNLIAIKKRVSRLYNANDISRYRKIWYQEIVPEITLKHVTRDLKSIRKRGYLMSLANREAEGDIASNAHTHGRSARAAHSYYTLGLKDHATVLYWDNKPEEINIHLGEAYQKKRNLLPGLWIGSHISPQVRAGHLPGKYFGNCLRRVYYTDDKKFTQYSDQEGRHITVECNRGEQIYSAENGLHEIFDGLLYQILEEISFISGSYQKALSDSPATILRQSFKHFFIPDVYPEAKDCTGMTSINKSYVSFPVAKKMDAALLEQLDNCILNAQFSELEALLKEHPQLIHAEIKEKPVINKIVEEFLKFEKSETKSWLKIIELMLENNVDFNGNSRSPFNDSVLGLLISDTRHEALELLEKLLNGIPDRKFPLIRHTVNFHHPQKLRSKFKTAEPILMALEMGNWPAFLLLIKYGVKVDPASTLIRCAYLGKLHDKLLILRDEYKADCNARTEYGDTVLSSAIDADDDNFIIWLRDNFPSLRINSDSEYSSSLHRAVCKQSLKALIALLQLEADPALTNFQGRTAYDLSLIFQHLPKDTTVGYKFYSFKGSPIYDELSNKEHARVINVYKAMTQIFEDKKCAISKNKQPTTTKTIIAAAILVKRTNKLGNTEILFIRKSMAYGQISNRFLFPGGLKDPKDKDLLSTSVRECEEETGITASNASTFYRSVVSSLDAEHHLEVAVADSNREEKEPVANDDAEEALWIDWTQVERRITATKKVLFFYNNIMIETSNALLVEAALKNDLETSKNQIDHELDLQYNTKFKLLEKIQAKDISGFENLIQNEGLNIDEIPCAAIGAILQDGWLDLALKLKANLDLPTELGEISAITALEYSITRRHFDQAKRLINHGANFNTLSNIKCNSLVLASAIPENSETLEFIRFLLMEKRAKISEDIGALALISSLSCQNLKTAELLLEYDTEEEIDLNRTYSDNSTTILKAAAKCGSFEFFAKLLTRQVDFSKTFNFDTAAYLGFLINDSLMTLSTQKLQAPGGEDLLGRMGILDKRAKTFSVEGIIHQIQMHKMVVKHTGQKIPKGVSIFGPQPLKPTAIMRTTNGRIECLFVHHLTAASNTIHFLDVHAIDSEQPEELLPFYSLELTELSFRNCEYSLLMYNEKVAAYLKQVSDEYALHWLPIDSILSNNGYYHYQHFYVCQSDALILKKIFREQKDEFSLDKSIFYKAKSRELLEKAYIEKNQEEFRHLVLLGCNVNTFFEYRKPKHQLGYSCLLYFDLKYNEGKWCDFLLSLGADVNCCKEQSFLPVCQAIMEKDYVIARKMIVLGARVDLVRNQVSALSLLSDCEDDEFKEFVQSRCGDRAVAISSKLSM